jgi:predicted nucleic acid-binding protein
MEILEELEGGKVYLDTNVFIYAVEAVAAYRAAVEALFTLLEESAVSAVTSELTLAEALTKPLELERHAIAAVYEAMLTPSAWLAVMPIEPSVLIEAARLQAQLKLRLPDAIHLATAIATDCPTVVSNDRRLRAPPGIKLLRLKQEPQAKSS